MANVSAEHWTHGAPIARRRLTGVEMLQIFVVFVGMVTAYLALTYSLPTVGASAPSSSGPHAVFDQ